MNPGPFLITEHRNSLMRFLSSFLASHSSVHIQIGVQDLKPKLLTEEFAQKPEKICVLEGVFVGLKRKQSELEVAAVLNFWVLGQVEFEAYAIYRFFLLVRQ